MNQPTRVVAAMSAAVLALPGAAEAIDTKGFFFGADLHTSHVGKGSELVDENGGGLGLQLGWGLTPSFALRLASSVASHGTAGAGSPEVAYTSVTLEGAYLFRDPEALRPYLFGGLGGFGFRSRDDVLDVETTGPGVVFGGGLLWFVGNHVAFDLGVRGDFINWKEQSATVTLQDGSRVTLVNFVEQDGRAVQALFGITIWP